RRMIVGGSGSTQGGNADFNPGLKEIIGENLPKYQTFEHKFSISSPSLLRRRFVGLDRVIGVDGVDVRVMKQNGAVVALLVDERHSIPAAAEDDHLGAGHCDLSATRHRDRERSEGDRLRPIV